MLCKVSRKAIKRLYKFGNCEFEYLWYVISEDGILCWIWLVGECFSNLLTASPVQDLQVFSRPYVKWMKIFAVVSRYFIFIPFSCKFQEHCFVNIYCSCRCLVGTLFTIAKCNMKRVNQFRPFTSDSLWLLEL